MASKSVSKMTTAGVVNDKDKEVTVKVSRVCSKVSSKVSHKPFLHVNALLNHIANTSKLSAEHTTEAINLAIMEAAGYNKCHRAPDSFADVAMARAEASPDTDTTNIKIVQLRDVDGHSFEEIAEILNGAEILQANLAVHTETPGLDFNATDVTGNGEGDDTGNVLPTTHDNTPTTGLVTDNSDSTPTTSTWTAQDCYARYVRAKNSGQVADEAEAEATANRPPSAPAGEEDEQTAESTDDSAEEPASTNEGDAGQSEVGGAERIPMETAWDDEAEDALAVAVEELRQDHWYRVALRVRDLTGRTYLPSECERRFLTSECFEQQYLEAHRAPRE